MKTQMVLKKTYTKSKLILNIAYHTHQIPFCVTIMPIMYAK